MSAPCPTLGFHLAFALVRTGVDTHAAAVRAAFLEMIAARGLVGEAASDDAFDFVISGDGTQATESDREGVVAWLDEQPAVASHQAGPLIDLSERL